MNIHSAGTAIWRAFAGTLLLMLYARVMPKDPFTVACWFVLLFILIAAVLMSYEPE